MCDKRLHDEIVELPFSTSDLKFFIHLVSQPFPHFIEIDVDSDETELATTFDQLVGLDNQMLQDRNETVTNNDKKIC